MREEANEILLRNDAKALADDEFVFAMRKRLRKKLRLQDFLPMTFLLALLLVVCAQQEALAPPVAARQKHAPEKVYTYVEQMPQLPGGGGQQTIVNEIQKRTRFPSIDTSKQMRHSGIKYAFVVDTTGNVCDIAMVVSSDNLAVDQAILDAVRSMPKLSPGRQDGRLVPVRFTFNIGCILVR